MKKQKKNKLKMNLKSHVIEWKQFFLMTAVKVNNRIKFLVTKDVILLNVQIFFMIFMKWIKQNKIIIYMEFCHIV